MFITLASKLDFDRLFKQLGELNGVAGEDRAQLVKRVDEGGVVHQFEYPGNLVGARSKQQQ